MKKLTFLFIFIFVNSHVYADIMTCTVKDVYSLGATGNLEKGGLAFSGAEFKVDSVSGAISGRVMDNVSSPLCKYQVLAAGTSDTSFKVMTNCGNGVAIEYLTINSYNNNEFLGVATPSTIVTGICR